MWRTAAALAAAAVVVSCTDPVGTAVRPDPVVTHASTAAVLACDLTSAMMADARTWFPQPERRAAQESLRALSAACSAGDAAAVAEYAVGLLRLMETVVDGARGGDAAAGSRLGNALLACTTGAGCPSGALPGLDLAGALSLPAGLFRLYTGTMSAPAVARASVPFVDFDGRQNAALFGVELSGAWSWTAANGGSHLVLLYGQPVTQNGLTLLEPGFGGLQYDFNRWPRTGPFVSDDIVHVGVCFASRVTLPHDDETGETSQPRMQREGTLLSDYEPTFCPPGEEPLQASLAGSLAAITRSVLPARWLAMFTDVRTPIVGGSALDFSRFAPVAADAQGRLEMLTPPVSVARTGASIGPVTIRALSGGGTPMERVLVTLYVANNSGVPAGAELVGNTSGYTVENDGTVTIDGLVINKTGGYTICARGELTGFTFTEACSGLFHVRN